MSGLAPWLPLTLLLGALPAAWGAWESRVSDRVHAAIARGPSREARVVSKTSRTSSGSKNSSPTRTYYVRFQVGDSLLERRVTETTYRGVEDSILVPWYDAPGMDGGFSALEVDTLTGFNVIGYGLGLLACIAVWKVWRKALPGAAVVAPTHERISDPTPVPEKASLSGAWRDQLRGRTRFGRRLLAGTVLVAGALAGAFAALGTPGASWVVVAQGLSALLASAWTLGRAARLDHVLWRDGRVCRGRVLSVLETGSACRLTLAVEAPEHTVEARRWMPLGASLSHGDFVPVLVLPGDPLRVAPVPLEVRS